MFLGIKKIKNWNEKQFSGKGDIVNGIFWKCTLTSGILIFSDLNFYFKPIT